MRRISREQHIDELMLLNHSEAFYENPEMVEFVRTAMLNNPHPQPPDAFARQLGACSRHDTRDRLGALTMPTHVIGGEFDILVPVWKSREIAALIPGAKLTVLPNAPHGLSLERAEEFNAAVLGFIREAAAAPRSHLAHGRVQVLVNRRGAPNSTISSTRATGRPAAPPPAAPGGGSPPAAPARTSRPRSSP